MIYQNNKSRNDFLDTINSIVIKIGSSSLTHDNGLLDLEKMDGIVRQIANIHNSGKDIIIVSSGAIAAGRGKMNFEKRPTKLEDKQAAAAVGQVVLMHMYQKMFAEYGIKVGQILLTKYDIGDPQRSTLSKNTMATLKKHRIIPIVNENDAVATDEIKVGDNDTLSALVCNLSDSDCLVLLSDINGLYDSNPHSNKDAKLIEHIDVIDDTVINFAGDTDSSVGTGGMITKINAAKLIMDNDKGMFIINSDLDNSLNDLISGKNIGSLFLGGNANE